MSRTKVLLVEDQEIALLSAKIILTQLGCDLEIAKDGNGALELANSNQYDLILIDIGLPDIDGIEVTSLIRNNKECLNNQTPIVALTAHGEKKYQIRANNAGVNDFLIKPLTKEVGLAIIKKFITNGN